MSRIADLQARLGGSKGIMMGLRPGAAPPIKKKPKADRSDLENATLNRPINKQTKKRAKRSNTFDVLDDEKKAEDSFGTSLVNDIDASQATEVKTDYSDEKKSNDNDNSNNATTTATEKAAVEQEASYCELVNNNVESDSTVTIKLLHNNWQDFFDSNCVNSEDTKGLKISEIKDNPYGNQLSKLSGIIIDNENEWQLFKIGKKNVSKKGYEALCKDLSKNSKFSGKAGFNITFKKVTIEKEKEQETERDKMQDQAAENKNENDNENQDKETAQKTTESPVLVENSNEDKKDEDVVTSGANDKDNDKDKGNDEPPPSTVDENQNQDQIQANVTDAQDATAATTATSAATEENIKGKEKTEAQTSQAQSQPQQAEPKAEPKVEPKQQVKEEKTQEIEKEKEKAKAKDEDESKNEAQQEEKKMDDDSKSNVSVSSFKGYDRCTSLLSWDEIPFLNKEEREGAISLADKLASNHGIEDVSPFEMARFFIGSKCRIEKATEKYLESQKFFKKNKFDQITDDQLNKCFAELSKCMDVGGIDKEGYTILGLKANAFLPKKYESENVLLKSFFLFLNMVSEDLNVLRNGVIFVGDMKKFGFKNFSKELETLFVEILQNVYPLRLHAMYMVDSPKLLEIALKVMRPLMKQKMKERMFIVNRKKLSANVSNEVMPILIGGSFLRSNTNSNDKSDSKNSKDNSNVIVTLDQRLKEYNEKMQSAYFDPQAKKWVSKL